MDKFDVLVMGGGFRSVAAAWGYAKQGRKTALVEGAPKIGGFMSPINWDGDWIDKGPQFFDNFQPADVELMNEMIGPDVLMEIGFEYGSYTNGELNCDFAIPDWRALGNEVAYDAFQSLLRTRLGQGDNPANFNSLDDLLAFDGGPVLYPHLAKLAKKFIGRPADEVAPKAASYVSFLGRKKLFDQETSVELKKAPLLDGILAASKASVPEERANLYPRGSSLETVRVALEKALEREGVTVFTDTVLNKFDAKKKVAAGDGFEAGFDTLYFGVDIRESQRILTGQATIAEKTHILPEIFHCFVVPADSVAKPYYVVDYDPEHASSRITNFCNYMGCVDKNGYGVICVEEPVSMGDARWENAEANLDQIFAEVQETGTVTANSYQKAKSFKIPATYKFPLVGIDGPVDQFFNDVNERFGDNLVLPDPYALTRKVSEVSAYGSN